MGQQPQPQPQGPAPQLLAIPGLSDDTDIAEPPRTPWWRRRTTIIIVSLILLLILLGGILLAVFNRRRPTTFDFQQVTQGNLSLTISATGPIQSGVYNVVFSGSGLKIDEIDVKVGQKVKKGDLLGKLDKTALQDALNQAQATVLAAEANLGSTEDSYTKTQAQEQASIAAAQTALANDQANLTNTQQESQASIATAQTTLANDQANLVNVQAQSQASINAAQTALNDAQTSLNQTLAQSQAQVTAAFNTEQTAIAACEATPTPTPAPPPPAATPTPPPAATSTPPPPAATPTPTPTPTASASSAFVPLDQQSCIQAAQDAYNQVVAQTNAANATAQNAVNAAQQALNQAHTTADANNAAAQAKITADQQALQAAIANASGNDSSAQARIATDQKALATAQAQAAATLAQSQSQVTSQEGILQDDLAALQTAQDNLANATLTAPHDGIVTTINGTVGGTPGVSSSSTSSSSAGTFIQIVDTSVLQVLASVNEADTANLKVGEPVTFTVNSYGSRLFRGTVSAISPSGQTVSNVVTYPVYIDVDMSPANLKNANLLPGMTANVTVTVVNRGNVLLLPVNAINFARLASSSTPGGAALITRAEALSAMEQARQMLLDLESQNPAITTESPIPAYVLEQVSNKIVVKPVVLGLTDGSVYELLSGLSLNEVVIVGSSSGSSFSGGGGSSGGGTTGG